MTRPEPADPAAILLKMKKQIDAICDHFELAWESATSPRIEDYLAQHPSIDRRSLLAELLASELGLRKPVEPDILAQYTARFPHDRELLEAVFQRCRFGVSLKSAANSDECFQVVSTFRERWRTGDSTTAIYDGDRGLRELCDRLARYQLQAPPDNQITPPARLWLSILMACRRQNSRGSDVVDRLIREVLAPFPPGRQAILIDVLFGHTTEQAAKAGGVTQRTVINTVQVAKKLLDDAR